MSMSYEERQEKWIARNCVKIGDRVRVLQKYEPKTCGDWVGAFWIDQMNGYVKKTGKIVCIEECGIQVDFGDDPTVKYWFPYSVLRKEKEMKKSYEERQDEWINKNDLKIGDKVRVIRKAESDEDGWLAVWATGMDAVVGKAGVVKRFLGNIGIRVSFDKKLSWSLPYFVLEKVVEHKDKEWEVSYGLKVKTGDPVLVRDDEDENWRYALFSDVITGDRGGYWYRTCGLSYKRCIPYVGNEHLVGTKNDYKAPEEPTKPKFVFGAKVKATLSCGEEKEGVLIGFDEEDDDTPFEVAVQDEDAELGRIRYWAKSVTYID